MLGLWVIIYGLMTEGPTIKIHFQTAQGLEADKTKIKLRDVEVGQVIKIELDEDIESIVATVKLDRVTAPLLREDTQFWVVRALVGAGGVSGINTIFSGAYIEMEPGEGPGGIKEYTGLESPPLTPVSAPGRRLVLLSDDTSSVSTGDSVLYKGFKVGRVEDSSFDHKIQQMRSVIFIDAPYHELVHSSVRFWDISGISLKANADGINIVTGSLDTIMLGGVAFATLDSLPPGKPVEDEAIFKLYPTRESINQNPFRHGFYLVAPFKQSLRGLAEGAPVEYRGIKIGRVERILVKELMSSGQNGKGAGSAIPVLLYLEPGRLEMPDNPASIEQLKQTMITGVGNGLRATLKTGNLLTGSLFVNFEFYPDAELADIGEFAGHPTIPTIVSGLGQLEQKLTNLLDKLNNLPLEQTVISANSAIDDLDKVILQVDSLLAQDATKALPVELNGTLKELRKTVSGLSPGTPMYQSLNSSLIKLDQILQNLENLTRTISDKPNSVLLPTQIRKDPNPEAK
jgi:paraquat-inducible protein B